MTSSRLFKAILNGDVESARQDFKNASITWTPPQVSNHPLWALAQCLREKKKGYPWEEMLHLFSSNGCALDVVLTPTLFAWFKAKKQNPRLSFDIFSVGIDTRYPGLHPAPAPSACLFHRAVGVNDLDAVKAFIHMGSKVDGEVWESVTFFDEDVTRILVENTTKRPLEATESLARWIEKKVHLFPVAHPVWSLFPDGSAWKGKLRPLWRSMNEKRSVPTWLLARPQDLPVIVSEAKDLSKPIWPFLLGAAKIDPSCSRGLLEYMATQPDNPSGLSHKLRLGEQIKDQHVSLTLPPLQWLRHESSRRIHNDSPDRDKLFFQTMESMGHSSWTARGEGPYTEGELAALIKHSPLRSDDEIWIEHPEWMAPHAITGRTPLFHVQDELEAQRWWSRGCRLDAVDAQGNQVFPLLLAKAMLWGSAGKNLADWVAQKIKDGHAPSGGTAYGRTWEEWAQGRQDLANLARRYGTQKVSPSSALLSACGRLHVASVNRLLKKGADVNYADAQGVTSLQAVLEAHVSGPASTRNQATIIKLLKEAGFIYRPLADGVFPIEKFLLTEKESKSITWDYPFSNPAIILLRDWHDQCEAPWSASLLFRCTKKNDFWSEHLGPRVHAAMSSYLLNPSSNATDDELYEQFHIFLNVRGYLWNNMGGRLKLLSRPSHSLSLGGLDVWEERAAHPANPKLHETFEQWKKDEVIQTYLHASHLNKTLEKDAVSALSPSRLRL